MYFLTNFSCLLSFWKPLAVVSWGRSLEMSRITLEVCDWLFTISSNISQDNSSQRAKYNLYLTKPAPADKPENTGQEMSKVERLKVKKLHYIDQYIHQDLYDAVILCQCSNANNNRLCQISLSSVSSLKTAAWRRWVSLRYRGPEGEPGRAGWSSSNPWKKWNWKMTSNQMNLTTQTV